jgi:hypothetical protein
MKTSTMITITTIVPKPINMGFSSPVAHGAASAPEGVLDLRADLLGVALELVTAAFSAQGAGCR